VRNSVENCFNLIFFWEIWGFAEIFRGKNKGTFNNKHLPKIKKKKIERKSQKNAI